MSRLAPNSTSNDQSQIANTLKNVSADAVDAIYLLPQLTRLRLLNIRTG